MLMVFYQYVGCHGPALAGVATNLAQAERIAERVKAMATQPLAEVRIVAPGHNATARRTALRWPKPPRVKRHRAPGRGSPWRHYSPFNVLGYTPEPRARRRS